MSNAPVYEIDPAKFAVDPYPDLKRMRAAGPLVQVPQLGATLMTRRNDVFTNEKKIDIFSSWQPKGLMTVLMGENMMRKDGDAHMSERKAIFPTVSPKTVKEVWRASFEENADRILDALAPMGKADLVRDYAMPLSAEALKAITGLTNMHFAEMNRVSQGMIDGCANYAGDPGIEANCHDCTASIDRHIDERWEEARTRPDHSLLSVQLRAGLSQSQIRANIKLAISGGQNEPRDAIAGAAWALLAHPGELALIGRGEATWMQAFEEYARWISPIGMSPRRIAVDHEMGGVTLNAEDRLFLMFGSANRDETVFDDPDEFRITRDTSQAIAFGAGPHFCAGAWASRALIAEVALPKLFGRLKNLRLDPDRNVKFTGWAFRGPLTVPVVWDA
ncbi:MAG: cytochrome P450 [Nitratireductor sp.]|nr:cytochrome P450 [Nitratireductor sp.]